MEANHSLHYETWKSQKLPLLGLESASEQGTFSSETEDSDYMPSDSSAYTNTSLLGLNGESWNASLVVANLERVPHVTDVEQLQKLLNIVNHHEHKVASYIQPSNIVMISQRAEQLTALSELVERIQLALNLHAAKSNSSTTNASSKTIYSLFEKMPNLYLFKSRPSRILEGSIRVELNAVEWSLLTIKKLIPLLDNAKDDDLRELSRMAAEQICYTWVQQKQDISSLEKEQFYVANLALIKSLKLAINEQLASQHIVQQNEQQ